MRMCAFYSFDVAEVHVWCASVTDFEGWDRLDEVLSQSEEETARRFRYIENRRTYELAHGLLRHILARYLGSDPAALEFAREACGKPYLTAGNLAFNLSHSGDRVAIAVSRSEAGVDLEKVRIKQVDANLIDACFTTTEQHWLQRDVEDAQRGFFRLWTLKEAVLKADGRGLSMGCHAAVLHMGPEGDSATVAVENTVWKACELSAGPEYCLAVAAREIRDVRLRTVRHVDQIDL